MSNKEEKLFKQQIIKEISNHVNINERIVKIVYEGFIDVALSEIANKGVFEINELFKVSSNEVKSNITETGKTVRITARLSSKLRRLFKLVNRGEVNKTTPSNVRERLRSLNSNNVKNKKPKEININDLLSDDEEW